MKLIVGLGNPGTSYAGTRHNIGRRLIEHIAAREGGSFARKPSLRACAAEVSWDCEPVVIAYPESYMNISGGPVKLLAEHFGVRDYKNLLIVVDDIALPFGRFRLRGDGSPGGHNGLASIEDTLRSAAYARLRVGIGVRREDDPNRSAGADEPLRNYVLAAFSRAEEKEIPGLLEQGAEACRRWAVEPFAKAAHWVNSTKL